MPVQVKGFRPALHALSASDHNRQHAAAQRREPVAQSHAYFAGTCGLSSMSRLCRRVWQARVNRDWRFYFKIENDTCFITNVTPHPK
jgi:hypothetical protein